MRLLLVVGGGGHFSPALSVIDSLPKEWDYLVVGRKYTFEGDAALSLEFQTATRLGIPYYPLTTGRLQRKISRQSLRSLLKIPLGNVQAMTLLRQYKPDVIVSFGGYVALPIAFAARLFRIPIIIHEQTLGAGLSNKIISKFAKKICISWKESAHYFPREKIVYTGNPIRSDFMNKERSTDERLKKIPTIYITGGSGGAHSINTLVDGCLQTLLEKYYVIHQTGDAKQFGDFEKLQQRVARFPESMQKRYLLTKFVKPEDVSEIMHAADLVVCRSGINTVTELLFLGKPCLLIPLPFGQKGDQDRNAAFVQTVGIGKSYEQQFLTSDHLAAAIDDMIGNLDVYKRNAQKAHDLIPRDAAEKIIAVVRDATKT